MENMSMDNKSQTQKTATVFLSEIFFFFFLKEGDIVSKCFQRVNQNTYFVLHYLREYMLINQSAYNPLHVSLFAEPCFCSPSFCLEHQT